MFCYENYVNSGFAVKFNNFKSLEAKDDTTLIMTFNGPNTAVAGLDHVLCNVQLYTRAAWDQEKFATAPVATGPYKLVEYVSGSKIVVEVNEDYWNAEPTAMRQQNADRIVYNIVTEGAQNVVGLQNGSLDISSNVPAENFEQFAADSKYFTASVPTNEIYVMLVNCETVPSADMRKALFYAIDSAALSTIEALELDPAQQNFCFTVRTAVDLRALGLTEEEERKFNDAGVWIDPAVETFYEINGSDYHHLGKKMGGSHLCLTMSRPCPTGGMEKVTLEWIGYGVKDGKIWRDETTPEYMFGEEWLRMALTHTTVEAQQLGKFLPELYAEYSGKPDDAD